MGFVTFNNKGRLGNYLFECAAALSYAIDNDLNFTIPFPNKNNFWNPIYFKHLFRNHGSNGEKVLIKEDEGKYFEFKSLPFKASWMERQIILDGYFQNEKYFSHNLDEILELWKLDTIPKIKNYVGIHVRRGDFLQYTDKHIVLSKDWITTAMDMFPGFNFCFFSDDIAWCKTNFPGNEYSTGDILADFKTLAGCEAQIISPSTFGYWATLVSPFNGLQPVVITDHWFKPGFKENGDSLIKPHWIKIKYDI